MIEIIPSILTSDPIEARDKIEKSLGIVERVQIDFVDGEFADNKTISPADFDLSSYKKLKFDAHLMVSQDNADYWLNKALEREFERIIIQVESLASHVSFREKCRAVRKESGIALDIESPVEKLTHGILSDTDVVLLMSVKAGFGGQTFDGRVLEKIRFMNKFRKEKGFRYRIGVDGGISENIVDELINLGVDEIVIGKRLFNGNLGDNIKRMEFYAKN